MNKSLLSLALSLSLTCLAGADPATNTSAPVAPPPAPPGGGHMGGMGMGGITPEEGQELMEAHSAALQANPDLQAEGKALQAKIQAYQKKVEAAMVKADPNVGPILAEIDAERAQQRAAGGGPGGPPPPPSGKAPGQ